MAEILYFVDDLQILLGEIYIGHGYLILQAKDILTPYKYVGGDFF